MKKEEKKETKVAKMPTTPKEQQEFDKKNQDSQANTTAKEKEDLMLNDQMAPYNPIKEEDKKGEHPFNSKVTDGKLTLKHKLTQDDLFLNPELRNLGFVEGEIVEATIKNKSSRHENK